MSHIQINAMPGMVATTAVQYTPASGASWSHNGLPHLYKADVRLAPSVSLTKTGRPASLTAEVLTSRAAGRLIRWMSLHLNLHNLQAAYIP
ncbi:hypothetical protein J2793_006924 [Paraburkholderia caledonica]|uniref:Uncharacterized protein n=1 Tax=Paraburkholderia caledonica TaxID=134536 RepID=A0AB73IQQ6_9BURK|nr:hypothetical protein [Paraburkholderia caledonica]